MILPSAKIDIDGNLFIKRYKHRDFVEIYCIHKTGIRCGDWCPAFRDPSKFVLGFNTEVDSLELCKEVGSLNFKQIIDERMEQHTPSSF